MNIPVVVSLFQNRRTQLVPNSSRLLNALFHVAHIRDVVVLARGHQFHTARDGLIEFCGNPQPVRLSHLTQVKKEFLTQLFSFYLRYFFIRQIGEVNKAGRANIQLV
ncbi:MAG TPA: hypothetical protein VI386_26410 [Candidatus Sulfotelmatobacter sp.]